MRPTTVESVTVESVPSVAVEGRERVAVSPGDDFSRSDLTCTIECASGRRATDTWTGVPVGALVRAADFPDDTTHLRVEAGDGFAAHVPILPALSGLLAFDREGDRDDDELGLPRLVAADVDGERLVKRVRRVSAVALDPDETPEVG